MTNLADRDFVQRCLRREPGAIDALVLRLECVKRMVAAQNARYGAPLNVAELTDVVQDAVVKVWESLSAYRGEAQLETWVFRFAEFATMNAIRRKRRSQGQNPLSPQLVAQADAAGIEASEVERVHHCLDRLEQDEGSVVVQKHFEEATFDAIAARSQEPVPTIKSRYYRALQKLRFCLDPLLRREGP